MLGCWFAQILIKRPTPPFSQEFNDSNRCVIAILWKEGSHPTADGVGFASDETKLFTVTLFIEVHTDLSPGTSSPPAHKFVLTADILLTSKHGSTFDVRAGGSTLPALVWCHSTHHICEPQE